MQEGQNTELLEKISDDIRAMRKNLARLARESYRQDLQRTASTPERQEIWRLCDGSLNTDEIARRVGVSSRSVQYFVQDAEKLSLLLIVKRGYPKRTDDFDVIPPEWKAYKKGASSAQAPVEGRVDQ